MSEIIGRMDTWTYADTIIGKGTENVFENIVVSKIIGRMDIWTHADYRFGKGSEILLKILLCLKSLDVWTYGHIQT